MATEGCKERIWESNYYGPGGFHRPCTRNLWKDGFCKQHHPDSVKARDEAREQKWKEEAISRERTRRRQEYRTCIKLTLEHGFKDVADYFSRLLDGL